MTDAPDAALGELLAVIGRLLQIDRPLCVLDCETTGTNPELDRLVELTIARVEPGHLSPQTLHARVNPGIPIPAEATAIHGLSDADVVEAPPFRRLAPMVVALLTGADVIGFGHRRFDMRLIAAECRRVDRDNPCESARLVDVGLIFMKREPRTLAAAMEFFCGEPHADAHGTTADVLATLRVLMAQFERYPDLPRDVAGLDVLGRDPRFIDRDGKVVWRGGDACIGFGKFAGVPLRLCDPSYLEWMLRGTFPEDTKVIVRAALAGTYPTPPASTSENLASSPEGSYCT